MNYIEKMLTRKVAEALLAKRPFEAITVCGERGFDPEAKRFPDGDARTPEQMVTAIVEAVDEFDEAHVFFGGTFEDGYGPFVYIILGNGNGGWDMISDYSMSLQETLQPVLDFIEKEGN